MRFPSWFCLFSTCAGVLSSGGLFSSSSDSSTSPVSPVKAAEALPQLGSPFTVGVCLCDVPIVFYILLLISVYRTHKSLVLLQQLCQFLVTIIPHQNGFELVA